jgi:DNA processing protein
MGSETGYFLAFARVRGIGAARLAKLREGFGSLAAAWAADEAALRDAGLDARSLAALIATRPGVDPEKELALVEKAGVQVLTWDDPAYPTLLREVHQAPPCLWIKGRLDEADALAVAIVGTRAPTVYGKDAAARFATQLAQSKITVVSGLARGIDAVAHTAALDAGGRTLAVLGSGVDVIYPGEHRALAARIAANGAVISDYPLGTKPDAINFPPRNRIISGLSLGTVVVEADEKSGALITTKFAAEQGRDVFAVPGSIFSARSRGPNQLIRDGAILVRDAQDVLSEINPALAMAQAEAARDLPAPEDGLEAALMKLLGAEPIHIDQLIRMVDTPPEAVSAALVMLELKGLARPATPTSWIMAAP